MKTSELVAETRAILDDHSSMVTGKPDELWSNERILRYLNHAQTVMCREGWVLVDDTTAACCTVTLVADQATYALHKSVLGVLSAKLSDSDLGLGRRNWGHLHPLPPPDPDYWDTNRTLIFDAGRPQLYAVDPASSKLELWRKPDATSALLTLQLRVARLPLTTLTLDTDSTPEVKEEYHLDFCGFAAGSLLSRTVNNDAVEGASNASVIAGRGMIKDFNEVVEKARKARQRLMVGMPRYRFTQWGGDIYGY